MEELSGKLVDYLESTNARIQELSSGTEEVATTATQTIKQGGATQQSLIKSNKAMFFPSIQALKQHVLEVSDNLFM